MSKETISVLKENEQTSEGLLKYQRNIGGISTILTGVGFLLAINFGFSMSYIWPLIFLVPVVFSALKIYEDFRAGRDIGLTPIVSVFLMFLVALVWMFKWSWSNLWPVFLIIGGLYAFRATQKPQNDESKNHDLS